MIWGKENAAVRERESGYKKKEIIILVIKNIIRIRCETPGFKKKTSKVAKTKLIEREIPLGKQKKKEYKYDNIYYTKYGIIIEKSLVLKREKTN